MKPEAIALLSGGLDSTVTTAFAIREGFRVLALSFDYGQRHAIELKQAALIAQALKVEHHIVRLDLRAAGGSALTSEMNVPKNTGVDRGCCQIPITYVPARNLVFLSIAAAFAEARKARALFIGVNRVDYSGYPDCRPEFVESFEQTLRLGTKTGIEGMPIQVKTPIVDMTKAQIVRLGRKLRAPIEMSWSCYDPTEELYPCGCCDACVLRKRGFDEAEVEDEALKLSVRNSRRE